MANIQQAAKWLDEGKKVRRAFQMPQGEFLFKKPNGYIDYYYHLEDFDVDASEFSTEDFLAEDWEVYDC